MPWWRRPPPAAAAPRVLLLADHAGARMPDVEALVAALARALGCSVHVAVVGPAEGRGAEAEVMFRQAVADPEGKSRLVAQRLQGHGVAATVHVRPGPVAGALLALDRELRPDVLVLGPSQHAALAYAGYGGVLDQVKNDVGASLLVAQRAAVRQVAAAIDGSAPSLEAARTARLWAERLGVPLRLLVAEGVRPPRDLRAVDASPVVGDAGTSLVRWTEEHPDALLVLGSRGAGNPGLLRLGGTSDRVSWAARSSVLVVRPRRAAPAGGDS